MVIGKIRKNVKNRHSKMCTHLKPKQESDTASHGKSLRQMSEGRIEHRK